MSTLTLKAFLQLSDRLSAPLKVINKTVDASRKLFLEDKKALKELQKQQGDVTSFRQMQAAIGETRNKVKQFTEAEAKLAEQLKNTLAPTKAQQREFAKTKEILDQLKATQSGQINQLKELSLKLNAAGFSTKGFSASETQLAEKIRVANSAMEAQREKLKALEAQQLRYTNAQRAHQELMGKVNSAKSTGFESAIAGGTTLYALDKLIDPAKEWGQLSTKLQVTGVGTPALKHFQELASHNTIKGVTQNSALESLTEAQIIMRNPHEVEELMPGILKAKAVLESLYKSQGHGNASGEADSQVRDMIKTIELRGGTKSVAAFQEQQDYMMRAIMGSGGVLKSTDWLDAIKTGGAATKFMSNESFYYVLGHMIQESGGFRAGTGAMSAFSNLGLGRTTEQAAKFMAENGLIDKSQLSISKKTDKAMLGAGALSQAKLFATNPFEWMMTDLVPKLSKTFKAKNHRDISDDEMKMLLPQAFSNRTAGNAFLQMYMDRGNIARQLVAYRGAYGLDQGYKATFSTASGKQDDAVAKYNDMKKELGMQLLPMFTAMLNVITDVVTAIKDFATEHPYITKAILEVIATLGILMLVFGGLLVIITSILGPMLLFRGSLVLMRIAFGGLGSAAGGVPSALGAASGALGKLGQAAALFGAAYVGWQIGSSAYQYQQDEQGDWIGKGMVDLMAGLGSKDAKRMQQAGYGLDTTRDRKQAMEAKIAALHKTTPTTLPITTKPLILRGQQGFAKSHLPAAPVVNIYGATDPHAVGQEVKRQLDAHERKKADRNRGALTDQY